VTKNIFLRKKKFESLKKRLQTTIWYFFAKKKKRFCFWPLLSLFFSSLFPCAAMDAVRKALVRGGGKEDLKLLEARDAKVFEEWLRRVFSCGPGGFWPVSSAAAERASSALRGALDGKEWVPPEQRRFLEPCLAFVQELLCIFDAKRELSFKGVGQGWSLDGGRFVAADLGPIIDNHPAVPIPSEGGLDLTHLVLAPAPWMIFTNQDWGSNDPSARTILQVLASLDHELVKAVHVVFTESPSNTDFDPLIEVLSPWSKLCELTLSCEGVFDTGDALETLVMAVNPRVLTLQGYAYLATFPRLAQVTALEQFSVILPENLSSFPLQVVELCKALPHTAQKFSLVVRSCDAKFTEVVGLNLCLAALPESTVSLEITGVKFWSDQEAVTRVFGNDRFQEIALFDTGVTDTSSLLPNRRDPELFKTVCEGGNTLRKLVTDKFCRLIATVVEASGGLDEVSFSTPFGVRDPDFDSAMHAVGVAELDTLIYNGVATMSKDTLALEKAFKKRVEKAEQRARCLNLCWETLRDREEISLGALPVPVMGLGVLDSAKRLGRDQEYEEQAARAKTLFDELVCLVNEQKWLEKFHSAQVQFYDNVAHSEDFFDWISALQGILLFLNQYAKKRVDDFTQTMLVKVSVLEQRAETLNQRKHALESASADKRECQHRRKEE
jgi:hypothetical protein